MQSLKDYPTVGIAWSLSIKFVVASRENEE